MDRLSDQTASLQYQYFTSESGVPRWTCLRGSLLIFNFDQGVDKIPAFASPSSGT